MELTKDLIEKGQQCSKHRLPILTVDGADKFFSHLIEKGKIKSVGLLRTLAGEYYFFAEEHADKDFLVTVSVCCEWPSIKSTVFLWREIESIDVLGIKTATVRDIEAVNVSYTGSIRKTKSKRSVKCCTFTRVTNDGIEYTVQDRRSQNVYECVSWPDVYEFSLWGIDANRLPAGVEKMHAAMNHMRLNNLLLKAKRKARSAA